MSTRSMTVLQVVPELETGGAERTTVDIAAALVEHGMRAIVVSAGGRMVKDLQAVGGEHIEMPAKTKWVMAMRRNAVRLADLMEHEGVDLIHARSRAPAWSALWAARWTHRPFITTYHGAYNEKTILKNKYNSVMARGDVVIANSQFTADLISRRHSFAKSRIKVVYRGIDLARFDDAAQSRAADMRKAWNIGADVPILLNIARLTPWKGQDLLLDALFLLKGKPGEDFVCVLAGDDQGRTGYRDMLAEKARTLGISEGLRIVGHVSDVPAALAAATLAVQPSIEPEAFGRAAVEAQAAAVPVVVTDIGAVRETVLCPPDTPENARTGWRVRPGDPHALAEVLEAALSLPASARQLIGNNGHKHALKHFSLGAMTRNTLLIYQKALDGGDSALY